MHTGESLSTTIYQRSQMMEEVKQVYAWLDAEVNESLNLEHYCTDVLFDVRSIFHHYCEDLDAERLFGGFYALLPRLEKSYYLIGFRIRRWLAVRFRFVLQGPDAEYMELYLDSTKKSFWDIKNEAVIDFICAHDFSYQPSEIDMRVIISS